MLSGELVDEAGQVVAGSRQQKVVGREVALDLSREVSDTRLRPGQSATLAYRMKVPGAGIWARLAVVVEPDAFYIGFFETLLQKALEVARRPRFTAFEREIPLVSQSGFFRVQLGECSRRS